MRADEEHLVSADQTHLNPWARRYGGSPIGKLHAWLAKRLQKSHYRIAGSPHALEWSGAAGFGTSSSPSQQPEEARHVHRNDVGND